MNSLRKIIFNNSIKFHVGNKSKYSKNPDVNITHTSETGKKTFQPNRINWSYLYLGTIALIKAKIKIKIIFLLLTR